MRLHYETEQWLPLPVPEVFAFFANPANLPRLMPSWQRARIDRLALCPAPPAPGGPRSGIAAGNGTEIVITARALPLLPVRGTWLARIENFSWDEGFCDVQITGPFRYWRHCHSVRAAEAPGNGSRSGTTVRDHVEYELPRPVNHAVFNQLFIVPAFERLFQYRQAQASRWLTGGSTAL